MVLTHEQAVERSLKAAKTYKLRGRDKDQSKRMTLSNPMYRDGIKKKCVETNTKNGNYIRSGRIMRESWKTGRINPRKISDGEKLKASNRMKLNNPMKRKEIKDKVSKTLKNRTLEEKQESTKKFQQTYKKNDSGKAVSERMRKSNPMFNIECVKKMFATQNAIGSKKQSKLEKRFENLFSSFDNLQYTGNGTVWIRRQNPDFRVIGEKKAIETTPHWFNRTKESYAIERIKKYKECGWQCLVVFVDKDFNEDLIKDTVLPFMKSEYSGVLEYGKFERV